MVSFHSCFDVDLFITGLAGTSSHSSVGLYYDQRKWGIFFTLDLCWRRLDAMAVRFTHY